MSRPRAKRFLGMTVPQWGVLGVMLLCMCGIVVGGYTWLNLQVVAAYISPELEMPNITPPPTLTPVPTATATITPSPTPITYESLVPAGWIHFMDAGVEIWVPPSYTILTRDELDKTANLLDADTTALLMGLRDSTPSPFMMNTTLQVLARSPFGSSLDEMVDDQFGTLSRQGRLLERDVFKFTLETFDARRLIFDVNIDGTYAGLAFYAIYTDNAIYYLGFKTPFNELYTRLPDFDAAIQTFRLTSP